MSSNTQLGRLRRPMVLGTKTGRPLMLFDRRVILTSAAAATRIPIITNDEVPDGFRVFLWGCTAFVNGATQWATTATVKVRTITTNTELVNFPVAELTGDTFINAFTSTGVQLSGGTAITALSVVAWKGEFADSGQGIEVIGNANGTGSDLYVRVWGVIAPPQLTTANWGVTGSPGGGGTGGGDELIRG